MQAIETKRLLLRELTVDDSSNIFQLNTDPEVIKFTGDPPFENIESAQLFLSTYNHYKKYGFGRWAVIHKTDHSFIGWCGLKYNETLSETDIGFRFMKKYWNQGFATESAKACIEIGFSKFNLVEIIGRAMHENIGSIKVLEKIGLKYIKDFDFDGHAGKKYMIKNSMINV